VQRFILSGLHWGGHTNSQHQYLLSVSADRLAFMHYLSVADLDLPITHVGFRFCLRSIKPSQEKA